MSDVEADIEIPIDATANLPVQDTPPSTDATKGPTMDGSEIPPSAESEHSVDIVHHHDGAEAGACPSVSHIGERAGVDDDNIDNADNHDDGNDARALKENAPSSGGSPTPSPTSQTDDSSVPHEHDALAAQVAENALPSDASESAEVQDGNAEEENISSEPSPAPEGTPAEAIDITGAVGESKRISLEINPSDSPVDIEKQLDSLQQDPLGATPEIQRQRALSDAIAESLDESDGPVTIKKKQKKKRTRKFTDGKCRFFPHNAIDGRIYDNFLVVGLQEDNHELLKPYSSKVLYEHFEDAPITSDVAQFCFPAGVVAKRIRRTNSESSLHEVLYGREDSVTDRFVFVLSQEDGSFRYGICVRRPQLLGILPSFVSASRPLNAAHKFYPAADTVYCLISRFPFFSLHFDVLFGLLAQERLHRFSTNVFSDGDADAVPLGAEVVQEDLNASLQILEEYSRVSIPPPGQTLSFTISSTMRTVSFEVPKRDLESTIFSTHCMATVFELLTLENIMILFNAAMLEKQIVFISKSLGVLSATSLAIVAMLRPFTWMGLFIVPLPENLVDAVTAPVPFIVGLHHLPAQLHHHVDLIINLDDNRALLPKGRFPGLAADRLLVSNLKLQHELLFKRKGRKYPDHIPFAVSIENGPAIKSIVSAFHSYTQWLADKFVACFRVNKEINSMKLLRETFLPSVSHGNRQFVAQFLQSQQVSVFMENLFRERNEAQEETQEEPDVEK